LSHLCGPTDEHLRTIELALDVKIAHRHEQFKVDGHKAKAIRAMEVLQALYERAAKAIPPEQVQLMLAGDGGMDDDAPSLQTRRTDLRPRTPTQAAYLENIATHDISFGIGPAGTGKTYFANMLISELEKRGKVVGKKLAPTNKASSHIKGETIHKYFMSLMLSQNYEKKLIKNLNNFDYIIVDEISMVKEVFYRFERRRNKNMFEAIFFNLLAKFFHKCGWCHFFKTSQFHTNHFTGFCRKLRHDFFSVISQLFFSLFLLFLSFLPPPRAAASATASASRRACCTAHVRVSSSYRHR
jgi:DNA replication protein DnaC